MGAVDAPRYPKKKEEGWWLVVGDTKTNQLVAIKRVWLDHGFHPLLAMAYKCFNN